MATYMRAPLIGMPTPAHTTTKAAKRARRDFTEWAARNPIRLGTDGKPTRIPLTRAEVVAAYVHPEPEVPQHRVLVADLKGSPRLFALAAQEAGYRAQATAWRGTVHPTWHVPVDTPVDPADYYGVVRDFVQVWVVTVGGRRVRVTWADSRFLTGYVGNRWVATRAEAEAALS